MPPPRNGMKRAFRRDISVLDEVFLWLDDFFAAEEIGSDDAFAARIAVEELFTNFVRHNTGGRDHVTIRLAVENERLTIQLEDLLREQGEAYEVVNAGVPGYGNSQELLLMKSLADDGVVGDIYLLMLFTNDILDNLRLGYGDVQEELVRPGFSLNQSGKAELKHLPVENWLAPE